MTLQQLDDVLKAWRARLSAVAENLLELQTDSTYQALTGTGGLDKVAVTGATAARVQPALSAMNGLFQQFGSLQAAVDGAETLRHGLPAIFGGEAKHRELEQLLFGASIEVETPGLPFAERTLVSGLRSTARLTPEQLLGTMTQTFAEVQAAVAAVGRAWTDFADAYDRNERELASLRSQTALPTSLLAASLDELAAKLGELRKDVSTDPLGALAALRAKFEPALAVASGRVAAGEQLAVRLRAARATFASLEQMHAETSALAAEARLKLAGATPGPQPFAEAKLRSLGEWLARLDHKREEGALDAVTVGLRNWCAAAEACHAQNSEAMTSLRASLAARGELRGRFDALKAKARAYGLAERDDVATLGSAAEQVLYTRPVDLERATAAVARYEQQLRTGAVPQRGVAAQ